MLDIIKQTGMKKYSTTIKSIQFQVQLNTKYHDDV